ncbi:MAG: MoaD/ThiS family protein [Planctomycetaceae bacterium]|nr:MoaD/ThiS family protein [Planctomycetaceae bacterium]
MKIDVSYVAQVRSAAGVGVESVEMPAGATAADLASQVAGAHGQTLEHLLLDEAGLPRKTILIFINNKQSDSATLLKENDRVTFLSPLSGG